MIKVDFILTSRIGDFSQKKIFAGTEKVFLEDAKLLSKDYEVRKFAKFSDERRKISQIIWSKWGGDFLYALRFFLKTLNSDVVVSYSFPLVAIFRPKKTIVLMNSLAILEYYDFFKYFYRQSLFLCCSISLKNELKQCYPDLDNGKNIKVLYNALPVKNLKKLVRPKHHFGKKLKFLFASAWVEEKGLLVLLQALSIIPSRFLKDVSLTIASNKNLWDGKKDFNLDYVKRINLYLNKLKFVRLLGGVKNKSMKSLYAKYDFTIFPSLWKEPFGLVALESIFAGTPVLAFKKGAVPEILHKNNSIILEIANKQSLARAIIKIITFFHQKKYPFSRENFYKKENKLMLSENKLAFFKYYLDKTFTKS